MDGLDRPVWTQWKSRNLFEVSDVMNALSDVMQSNKSVHLDEAMSIEVNFIRSFEGTGIREGDPSTRTILDMDMWRLIKRSVILIINKDTYCFGRALAVAIAKHNL